ncbi:MAG TPA: hypothetical protein VNA04_16725 [Thermoanaerobaculia bacterium]|nr:hypothetical protein [Thermoanaerobaculia bacterium]
MIDFRTPPPPLTARQRLALVAVTVVVAFSRLAALARGPWDWDEMLFLLALRDYDVALHHPHPPGFPLFILAARGGMLAGLEPFRALQAVNLVAAVFIVPAMVALCRELRFPFRAGLAAAAVFAFLPNVWFYGGTAFSDVAAIVLAVVASALLLRGARSPGALVAGALVLGVAVGFRPQNLLAGFAPAMIGVWSQWGQRRIGAVLAAAAAGMVVVGASYGGAVVATGEWARYRDALLAHRQYLTEVDSFRSEIRPSLLQVSDDFFIRPFRFPAINITLSALALLSLVTALRKRRMPVLLALASFGPFWLLAWLTLDFHSASRFSIGYMPLLAILSADAMSMLAGRVSPGERRGAIVLGVMTSLLAGSMFVWALPAVSRVRRELSPPLQAVRVVRQELGGRGTAVYVQKRLRPYAEYYLAGLPLVHVEEELPRGSQAPASGVYLREGSSGSAGARNLAWPRDRLWGIARRRYFEVSIVPLPAPTD